MTDTDGHPNCCWQCRAHYWIGQASKQMNKVNALHRVRLKQRAEINRLRALIQELFVLVGHDDLSQPLSRRAEKYMMLPHAMAEHTWWKRARAALDEPPEESP